MKDFIKKYLNRNSVNGKKKIDDLLERVVQLEFKVATLEFLLDEVTEAIAPASPKSKKASKVKPGRKSKKEVIERKREDAIDRIIEKKTAEGLTLVSKKKKRNGIWEVTFSK